MRHWPVLWPLPEPAVNRVYLDKAHPSKLILPVVPERESSQRPVLKPPSPEEAPTPNVETDPEAKPAIQITRDVIGEETIVEIEVPRRTFTLTDRKLTCSDLYSGMRQQARVSTRDPGLASLHAEQSNEMHYGSGLTIRAMGEGKFSSDSDRFFVDLKVTVEVNGQSFFEKRWQKTAPRHYV